MRRQRFRVKGLDDVGIRQENLTGVWVLDFYLYKGGEYLYLRVCFTVLVGSLININKYKLVLMGDDRLIFYFDVVLIRI